MSHSVSELPSMTALPRPDGASIQAALLRTLTDLYVIKPSHSPEEELQFTELSLRLIDVVDIPTRLVIAQRLHRYGRAPQRVMQALEGQMPSETAAAPAFKAEGEPIQSLEDFAKAIVAAALNGEAQFDLAESELVAAAPPKAEPVSKPAPEPEAAIPAHDPHATNAAQAAELAQLFFDASAEARRLILHNLEFSGIEPAAPLHDAHARDAARRLEVAALGRNPFEYAAILVNTLGMSQTLALRIAQDTSGEALIVAARALAMPTDILQRVILFLNPEIGHSVQRVYDLVQLHDEIAPQTARIMLSIWRRASAALPAPRHQPLAYDDEPRRARAEAMVDQRRFAPRPSERARRGNIA
jgi:hypothetical protein